MKSLPTAPAFFSLMQKIVPIVSIVVKKRKPTSNDVRRYFHIVHICL